MRECCCGEARRTPAVGAARVALLSLLLLAAGCSRKAAVGFVLAEPVAAVKVIRTGVDPTALATWTGSATNVPAGILPTGFEPAGAVKGRNLWAVVGWGPHPPAQSPTRPGYSVGGLWLFDEQWHGVATILQEPCRRLWCEWDASGLRLAVGVLDPSERPTLRVIIVETPVSPPKVLLRAAITEWPLIAWTPEGVLVVFQQDRRNAVMMVDPTSGRARQIYQEWDHAGDRPPISPDDSGVPRDGHWFAFSRVPSYVHSPASRGIWLIDLQTGACRRSVWERGHNFTHLFVRWETNRSFLFLRRGDGYRWSLCRASLRSALHTE